MTDVFATVPKTHKTKYLYDSTGRLDGLQVLAFLGFKKRDLAVAMQKPISSIRFDDRMSADIERYVSDIANCIEHVDEYFEGVHSKTQTWFLVKNPNLGGFEPRMLIRMGRVQKLLKIIIDLKSGNIA